MHNTVNEEFKSINGDPGYYLTFVYIYKCKMYITFEKMYIIS